MKNCRLSPELKQRFEELLYAGLDDARIAAEVGISPHSVANRRTKVYGIYRLCSAPVKKTTDEEFATARREGYQAAAARLSEAACPYSYERAQRGMRCAWLAAFADEQERRFKASITH